MPEVIIIVLLVLAALVVCSILGLVAFIRQLGESKTEDVSGRVKKLEEDVRRLKVRLSELVREEGAVDGEPPETVNQPEIPEDGAEEAEPIEEETDEVEERAGETAGEALRPPVASEPEPGRNLWERMEQSIGKRWIAWAGAIVIFLAVGFFIKHAIDMGWLGPTARCTLGVVAGVIMSFAGDVCLRRKMRGLGQGLVGGGLAVLYLSIFAAFSFYDLLPQTLAFSCMAAVTIGGMTLAVLHDALPIAFIALLGGLLTPVLCSTGENRRDALFAYVAILNLGALGVALFRRWRSLDALAFVGTWFLFTGWYVNFYTGAAMLPALSWLMVFFVIFLLVPFGYHLRTRRPVPLERFVMELIHAAIVFGFAWAMLHDEHQHVLGFVALGMAACYSFLGKGISWRGGRARDLLGFVALAMIFLTIAVPLHMGLHGTLILWVAESVVLLYLGYRFEYLPVRLGALLVFCVTVIRLFFVHWPLHEMEFLMFWNTSFGTVACVPVGGALFAWLHQRWAESRGVSDRWAQHFVGTIGALLGILILHAEIGQWLILRGAAGGDFDGVYLARFVRTILWAGGSVLMVAGGGRWRSVMARIAALLPLCVGFAFAMAMFSESLADHLMFLNLRFAGASAVTVAIFAWGRELRAGGAELEARLASVLNWLGISALLLFLSMETWQFARSLVSSGERARWVGLMALSVTWGLYALALLGIGFWKRIRSMRLVALGLFGVTGLKLVLVDMAGVEDLYRIVSFFAIGLLMVGASYLYHRAEQKLESEEVRQ